MIHQDEFQRRRQHFFAQMPNNSVAIFPAAPEYTRSMDQLYPFFQDNDFAYLTGFPEPEAVAVLVKDDHHGERYVLFNRIKDITAEIWVGERVGQERARSHYLADEAYAYSELNERLPDLLKDKDKLYYTFGRYPAFDQHVQDGMNVLRQRVRGGVKIPDTVVNAENIVFEMRLIKSEAELALMRKAGEISAQAHIRAMKACKPGMNEYEIEAELVYEFLRQGCEGEAYGSIVGGGKNACVLHYEANNCELKDGELLLIDAAGRYHGYCADITRTFPINGKFTSEQRDLYQVVLNAQVKAIETIKAGEPWSVMRDAAAYTITEGLVDLKILKGSVQTLYEQEAFAPYYMHRIGHWIGKDTHDVGRYKLGGEWRTLEAGMVTTVEPGIYIREGADGVDKRWWNMGIRVEDDIIITKDGYENVTQGVPKTIEEIEALMQS